MNFELHAARLERKSFFLPWKKLWQKRLGAEGGISCHKKNIKLYYSTQSNSCPKNIEN